MQLDFKILHIFYHVYICVCVLSKITYTIQSERW